MRGRGGRTLFHRMQALGAETAEAAAAAEAAGVTAAEAAEVVAATEAEGGDCWRGAGWRPVDWW